MSRGEIRCELRHPGHLKGTCGDDHLVGLDLPILERDQESSAVSVERSYFVPEPHSEFKDGCVSLETGDHVVAPGVAVEAAAECEAGEAIAAARRERNQRDPVDAPGGTDSVGAIDDRQPTTPLRPAPPPAFPFSLARRRS